MENSIDFEIEILKDAIDWHLEVTDSIYLNENPERLSSFKEIFFDSFINNKEMKKSLIDLYWKYYLDDCTSE